MPAHECLVFSMSYQVSLYVNLSCYMLNCYISVYMPSALFHMLYAKCYVLYAKLHMLDCYMQNAMTTAMSFSMTTEQIGHLIVCIYIYIYYPAMTLHITVTEKRSLLCQYGINLNLRSRVFQFVSISGYQIITWVMCISVCRHILASIKISVCQHIMASTKISNHRLFWFASISRHQSVTHITIYFGMPAYHDIL
jgi:hypothetical protein